MDNRTVKYLISRVKEHNNLLDNLTKAKRETRNKTLSYKLSTRIGLLSEKRRHYLKLLRHKGEGTLIQARYTISNGEIPPTEEKNIAFVNITKDDARDLLNFWAELSNSKIEILEIKEIEIKV